MSGELADVIKIFLRCLFLSPTAYPKLTHPMTGQIFKLVLWPVLNSSQSCFPFLKIWRETWLKIQKTTVELWYSPSQGTNWFYALLPLWGKLMNSSKGPHDFCLIAKSALLLKVPYRWVPYSEVQLYQKSAKLVSCWTFLDFTI